MAKSTFKFGKIGHIGIVVKDLEEARARYSAFLGTDKWYELVYDAPPELYYLGSKRDCNVRLLFGGKGHTVIELIKSEGDDNIYTAFLERHGEMIHHAEYNVSKLEKAIAAAEKAGLKVLQHASFYSAGALVRYAYVGVSEDDAVFELIETTLPIGIKKGDLPFETQLAALTGNYKRIK